MKLFRLAFATTALVTIAAPAAAQSGDISQKRTRIMAGAQIVPDYPGGDGTQIQPLIGLSRAKAGETFRYTSADQSFGFSLLEGGNFAVGPVVNFVASRSRRDTNGLLPKVPFTVEAGGFAQYETNNFRLRGEARRGVNGHNGLIGVASADFITRDGDAWLFAAGPRVTFANGKYQREYFGVTTPVPAAGLTAYRPKGGVQAVGAAASALYALNDRWGLAGYVKYDRLIDDAGRSPVVRRLGDRNQYSGGAALTYTF